MSDLNVRSEAVDVEQIMRQIRTRIREKRGVDYTETEIEQLAAVKLEKFLDPRGLRSDLVQHYRQKVEASPAPPNYQFEADTMFETHRGLLRAFRSLFRPLLKLFFNPDRITTALNLQSQINTQAEQRLRRVEEREMLSYELLHNMTLEVTRLGIEVHNLRMRVESLSSRVDFDERRAKALEGVVQYRTPRPASPTTTPAEAIASTDASDVDGNGERRRRRRRRRRRPGSTMAESQGQTWGDRPGAADADQGDDDATDQGAADADSQDSPES